MTTITNLTFVFIPEYGVLTKSLSLINSAKNPALYIIFNGAIRRGVFGMFGCGQTSNKVHMLNTTQQGGGQATSKTPAGH